MTKKDATANMDEVKPKSQSSFGQRIPTFKSANTESMVSFSFDPAPKKSEKKRGIVTLVQLTLLVKFLSYKSEMPTINKVSDPEGHEIYSYAGATDPKIKYWMWQLG